MWSTLALGRMKGAALNQTMFGVSHRGGGVDSISHVLMKAVEGGGADQWMVKINPVMTDLDDAGGAYLFEGGVCDAQISEGRFENIERRSEGAAAAAATRPSSERTMIPASKASTTEWPTGIGMGNGKTPSSWG